MSAGLAVHGHHRPTVRQNLCEMGALVDHRLDGKNVTHLDLRPETGPAIIRNLRVFVHPPANPMADVIAHDRITIGLCVLLYGPTDVTEMFSAATLFNGAVETFFSHANELEPIFIDFADRNCRRRVADKTLERGATVN